MITHIILENFRNWEQRVEIPLGRLTLLYGQNSAGKSSILCALDLLIQSMENADGDEFEMQNTGHRTCLGDFANLVYKHDIDRPIRIGVRILNQGKDPENGLTNNDELSYIATFVKSSSARSLGGCASVSISVNDMRLTFNRDICFPQYFLTRQSLDSLFLFLDSRINHTKRPDYSCDDYYTVMKIIQTIDYFALKNGIPFEERLYDEEAMRQLSDLPEGFSKEKFYEIYLEIRKALTQRLKRFHQQVTTDLFRCKHIGPLRKNLGRKYSEINVAGNPYNVGHEGESLLDVLLHDHPEREYTFKSMKKYKESRGASCGSRTIQEIDEASVIDEDSHCEMLMKDHLAEFLKLEKPVTTMLERTNKILRKIKFGYTLKVREFYDKAFGRLRLVMLRQISDGTIVHFADVGSGISQSLPIIVQVIASDTGILCIEQPEIHLHPRLQVILGQVFADSVAENPGSQIICETHSPEILLRILNRVSEKKLNHKDLSICYVHGTQPKNSQTGKFEIIRVDKSGAVLDEWPEGFLDAIYGNDTEAADRWWRTANDRLDTSRK